MDKSLRNRYSRQTIFPGIGEAGQAKLVGSSAVVAGCGALGCNVANLLVRAGVGHVRIIDRDFIEVHNLNRQVLFDDDDIRSGLPKAIAAANHLAKVNVAVKVEAIVADVNFSNIEELCTGSDIILDGLDNFETRLLINDAALKHGIPWVYGGAVGSVGMTMTIMPGGRPCLACMMSATPSRGVLPTCETSGVIGPGPAVIGALQAAEAIKVLVGDDNLNRSLLFLDVWSDTFNRFNIPPRSECHACHGQYDHLQQMFTVKATSLCGQSRAVQVIDTSVKSVNLESLAERLAVIGPVERRSYQLKASVGDNEIIIFPDGRAIIQNTIDETTAVGLYNEYVKSRV